MGAEKRVGRVGGLAIALGVGVAVLAAGPDAAAESGSPTDPPAGTADSAPTARVARRLGIGGHTPVGGAETRGSRL